MQRTREVIKQNHKQKKLQARISQAFCCVCGRLSTCSSEEAESLNNSDTFQTISSIAHEMVQERLDQMIGEGQRDDERRERQGEATRLLLMVAMEKSSHDPREDFRESMEQVIMANGIQRIRDLRRLLNCYVSMNSEEFRGTILEVFHEVCTDLFVLFKM